MNEQNVEGMQNVSKTWTTKISSSPPIWAKVSVLFCHNSDSDNSCNTASIWLQDKNGNFIPGSMGIAIQDEATPNFNVQYNYNGYGASVWGNYLRGDMMKWMHLHLNVVSPVWWYGEHNFNR